MLSPLPLTPDTPLSPRPFTATRPATAPILDYPSTGPRFPTVVPSYPRPRLPAPIEIKPFDDFINMDTSGSGSGSIPTPGSASDGPVFPNTFDPIVIQHDSDSDDVIVTSVSKRTKNGKRRASSGQAPTTSQSSNGHQPTSSQASTGREPSVNQANAGCKLNFDQLSTNHGTTFSQPSVGQEPVRNQASNSADSSFTAQSLLTSASCYDKLLWTGVLTVYTGSESEPPLIIRSNIYQQSVSVTATNWPSVLKMKYIPWHYLAPLEKSFRRCRTMVLHFNPTDLATRQILLQKNRDGYVS